MTFERTVLPNTKKKGKDKLGAMVTCTRYYAKYVCVNHLLYQDNFWAPSHTYYQTR